MTLIIDQVSKTYSNGVRALNQLSLTIANGMFGLLGPNGAGKSSLMRTIATLQPADSGSIYYNGMSVFDNPLGLRKNLGYLPQEFGVYEGESAESLLDYFALLKGIVSKKSRLAQVDKVLELTNLREARKQKVTGFSGGMKRRFGIAQLLLNDPKLIIVDEPTAGLDPEERTRFLNVIRSIGTSNTVIFSTHIVADVRELCQHLAIIDHGNVICEGNTKMLIESLRDKIWQTIIRPDQLSTLSARYHVLSSSYLSDHSLTVRIHSNTMPLPIEGLQMEWSVASTGLGDVYFNALGSMSLSNV
ncbi:MAG: ABC transporter ATP-binding protein [Cyclobacteriaceae bacterium]